MASATHSHDHEKNIYTYALRPFFFGGVAHNPSNLPLVTHSHGHEIISQPYALRPFFVWQRGLIAHKHLLCRLLGSPGLAPTSSCKAWSTGLHSRSNMTTSLCCFCMSADRPKESPARSTPWCFWKAFRPSQHFLNRVLISRTRFSDCTMLCSSFIGSSNRYAISRSLKASGHGSCNASS
jgi:hypothetical protein